MTLEIGALVLALSSINLKNESRRRQLTLALMGGGLVASSGAAALNFHQWQTDEAQPETTYSLPSLHGTPLAGSVAEYNLTAMLIEKVAPKIQPLIDQESATNNAFVEKSTLSLENQAGLLAAPREDETAFLLASDMHSNQIMSIMDGKLIHLINQQFGRDTISFVGLSGDITYGSAVEKTMVDQIAAMSDGAPIVAVRGNHDSDITKKQMEDAHITVLNGKTITVAGTSILGADDPRITRLFDKTTLRNSTTPAEANKKLEETTVQDTPTLLMLHEAYDLPAALGIGPISKESTTKWFNESTNYTDYQTDTVDNMSARLIVYGHWHRDGGQRVVWNDDGTWSVVAELSTAGGANGGSTLTNFTTPWSTPGQDAIQTIFYTNKKSQLVTGMQKVIFRPDGRVTILPRINIGSPDGQPFVTSKSAKKDIHSPQSKADVSTNNDRVKNSN